MTKPKKRSEEILDELVILHPILDKKLIKSWTDHELQTASEKFQEPKFLSYKINKKLEEDEAKRKRREFFARS